MRSKENPGNPKFERFHKVKMAPKWGISTYRNQNLSCAEYINKPNLRPFLPCVLKKMPGNRKFGLFHSVKNTTKMRKINRRWPKSNQFSRWSGYISMSNFWPFKVTAIQRNQLYLWCHRKDYPDSKVHGANMGPIGGRQGPGGPNVDPMRTLLSG